MDGKRIILYKQSWTNWLKVSIDYAKGPFMDVIDFNIKSSTMTHANYWTIIKLWSDNNFMRMRRFCKPIGNRCVCMTFLISFRADTRYMFFKS